MLHFETIEPGTLSLLRDLMRLPSLKQFHLVGGTALALKYGHRSSVDLDLFSHEKFDVQFVENDLRMAFREKYFNEAGHKKIGIFCYINSVKVDIIKIPHLPISEFEILDGIRIYSSKDIAAMKVQAILGRGKKKDFWDVYELFQHFTLQEIMEFHSQRYPNQMLAISIPNALTYFADADETEDPVSFKGQTWVQVKKGIQKVVRDYLS